MMITDLGRRSFEFPPPMTRVSECRSARSYRRVISLARRRRRRRLGDSAALRMDGVSLHPPRRRALDGDVARTDALRDVIRGEIEPKEEKPRVGVRLQRKEVEKSVERARVLVSKRRETLLRDAELVFVDEIARSGVFADVRAPLVGFFSLGDALARRRALRRRRRG